MANTTIGMGVALIVLGIVGFVLTGSQHPTALIPAGVGLLLVVLGIVARNPRARMHAMHGAALIGLLGFAGSVGGIAGLAKMMAGQAVQRPEAAVARSIMSVLCLAFVGLTVRSFISARIARRKSQADGGS
jgi:membrane-bound ClpP family serine protease